MRIGFITHQWPGVRLGGIGAYTLHAARGLARAGHEVHLFTLSLPADALAAAKLPANVHLHEITGLGQRVMDGTLPAAFGAAVQMGGEALNRLAMACLLSDEVRRVHRETPLDVVEGPEYEALALPLCAGMTANREASIVSLSRTIGVPIVTQIHSGSAIAREVGNLPASREQTLRELLELAAIESADGICAPSRQVLLDTRRATARDDLAAHAEVLPLPFEAGDILFSIPPAGGPVLYVGRIEWLKGSHLLVYAANEFLGRHPEAVLRLAGPDTMTAPGGGSMTAWMREHLLPGVRDRVIFLGELTQEQIRLELRWCSLFVAPSLRESYSYVCCEALAAGRPAVVFDKTGAAEVIAGAGLVSPHGDASALDAAMSRLWTDAPIRERMARAAYDRARTTLSGRTVIDRRVAFYQCVAAATHDAAAQRLSKLDHLAWIQKTIAALEARDVAALQALAIEWGAVKSPGMRVVEALARHQKVVPTPSSAVPVLPTPSPPGIRFHLYGAGRHTAKLLAEKSLWEAHGHTLVGLIDDHPRFQQSPQAFGLPVLSCTAAAQTLNPTDAVILSTDAFEDQFWQQTAILRERGVGVYRLYGNRTTT